MAVRKCYFIVKGFYNVVTLLFERTMTMIIKT